MPKTKSKKSKLVLRKVHVKSTKVKPSTYTRKGHTVKRKGFKVKPTTFKSKKGKPVHRKGYSVKSTTFAVKSKRIKKKGYTRHGYTRTIKELKGSKGEFEKIAKEVAKDYLGKPIPAKYRHLYPGKKKYGKKEALDVGRRVAQKIKIKKFEEIGAKLAAKRGGRL